jgi:hypothetical protein
MHKLLFLGLVFVLFASCKQEKVTVTEDASAFDISTENWPQKSKVSSMTLEILNNWPEYGELNTVFDGLYTVENTEDLSLIVEDLIEKQNLLAESGYPESFDQPQIKSRQKVFQTFVLKTKGNLEYRIDPQQSVKEMIEAYNAWHNQFDIITNNTLDIKKLLEE